MASGARQQRQGLYYRVNVGARTVAATLGGYALTSLMAAALARTLPGSRVEAVMLGTLLSYLVVPPVAIWAFLAPGPLRALAGVVAAGLLLWAVIWLAGMPA